MISIFFFPLVKTNKHIFNLETLKRF